MARRTQTGNTYLMARLRAKALLTAAQGDALDCNPKEFVYKGQISTLKSFEGICEAQKAKLSVSDTGISWKAGMSFRLEDKVCYVEDMVTPILAETLDRLGEHYLTDDTMLHLGTPIKLNPSGSRAVGAIFHIALADPDEGEGEGEEFNSDDDSVGFIVFGVARTLPELLEACNELLAANPAVRIVLGVKQYEMKTEQLVAIRSCKQGDGTVEKKAVSFGSKALDPSTVLLLERDGAQVSGVGLGGVACDRIGLEDYQMELPPADVVIDLYHLQRLLDGVTNEAPEPVWNDLGYELTLTEEEQRAWCEERERLFAEMRERNKDVEDPCKKKPKSKSKSKSKTKHRRLA